MLTEPTDFGSLIRHLALYSVNYHIPFVFTRVQLNSCSSLSSAGAKVFQASLGKFGLVLAWVSLEINRDKNRIKGERRDILAQACLKSFSLCGGEWLQFRARVPFVVTLVHSCSLVFHSCSRVFHSCSLVFTRVQTSVEF